jgi:hypothetical protein
MYGRQQSCKQAENVLNASYDRSAQVRTASNSALVSRKPQIFLLLVNRVSPSMVRWQQHDLAHKQRQKYPVQTLVEVSIFAIFLSLDRTFLRKNSERG